MVSLELLASDWLRGCEIGITDDWGSFQLHSRTNLIECKRFLHTHLYAARLKWQVRLQALLR